MAVVSDNSQYSFSDFFLSYGQTFSYQIPDPLHLGDEYTLISAQLQPNVWWENPAPQWLSVTNDGLLQGVVNFGFQEYSQGYSIDLEYSNGTNTETISDFFEVFVNPYVEENDWSKDFNYNLNYAYDPRDIFAASVLDVNLLNINGIDEYRFELKAPDNRPFDLVDADGNLITDLNSVFQIHHGFYDNEILGEDIVNISGYETYGDNSILSMKIQPNFYNGLDTFGETDVVQVSLLSDAYIKQGDILTSLSEVIPDKFVHDVNVAHEDRVSIDLSAGNALDFSNFINRFNYEGIFVNAGADAIYVDWADTTIPGYTSIAPDGTILDISAVAQDGHGLYIKTSPLSDTIYVNGEEGDWPIVEWSAGWDYIVGPSSGGAFRAWNFHNQVYESNLDKGLTFSFIEDHVSTSDRVLTVNSDYGYVVAENIKHVYGTRGNDIMIGDEYYQNFRGDGGYDTFTGGVGEDHFRLESHTMWDSVSGTDVLIDSFARITDFENVDRISIEDYGFSTDKMVLASQFSVTQDDVNNITYISINTAEHTIDNMFTIDGIFYLDTFYSEVESENGEINLRIKLTDTDPPNYIFGNDEDVDLEGTPMFDWIYVGAGDKTVNAYAGDDYIVQNGSGNQIYDGGQGNDTLEYQMDNFTDLPADFVVEVDLVNGWSGPENDPDHPLSDKLYNIENFIVDGDVNFIIQGDANNNVISTDGGDDIIRGGEGDDTLSSGAGTDTVYGDAGNDTIIQNGSGDQTYYGGEGIDTFELRMVAGLPETFVAEIDLVNGWVGPLDDP